MKSKSLKSQLASLRYQIKLLEHKGKVMIKYPKTSKDAAQGRKILAAIPRMKKKLEQARKASKGMSEQEKASER